MRELALNFDRFDMLYNVRARRAGNHTFIDIHLGFDDDRRMGDVRREIDIIRAAIAAHFPKSEVTIVIGPQDSTAAPASA
jgi:divalent metal cation (Fe/Co/Zn/Cd) transporter